MSFFDRWQIELADLLTRGHDLLGENCLPLAPPTEPYEHPEFDELAGRILDARSPERPVILMMGRPPDQAGPLKISR